MLWLPLLQTSMFIQIWKPTFPLDSYLQGNMLLDSHENKFLEVYHGYPLLLILESGVPKSDGFCDHHKRGQCSKHYQRSEA